MRVKFLRLIACIALLFLGNLSLSASPILGDCFSSELEFRRKLFVNEQVDKDSNITAESEGNWLWIVDKTPSINYDRSLLERVGDEVCYRAQLSASSVDLYKSVGVWLIDVSIPPIGLTAGKLGRYKLKSDGAYFILTKCMRSNIGKKNKAFSCNAWND